VVYSRYLKAWAVLEFLICLPIAVGNLYAIHTRHMNYEAIMFESEEDKVESVIRPEVLQSGLGNEPSTTVGNSNLQGTLMYPSQRMDAGLPLESPQSLQVQMIPK
jgi:hypothetical protein